MKKIIDEIFDKYLKTVWINPYTPKTYIPAENILPLKQEILNVLEKGLYKCKQK